MSLRLHILTPREELAASNFSIYTLFFLGFIAEFFTRLGVPLSLPVTAMHRQQARQAVLAQLLHARCAKKCASLVLPFCQPCHYSLSTEEAATCPSPR
jgi:hypothetical protein